MPEIQPERLYSFAEAARLIPSPHAGKRLHLDTLHRWRLAGRFKAEPRTSGGRRFWFVWGAELLKLLPAGPQAGTPRPASGRQRQAREEAARAELRRLGIRSA